MLVLVNVYQGHGVSHACPVCNINCLHFAYFITHTVLVVMDYNVGLWEIHGNQIFKYSIDGSNIRLVFSRSNIKKKNAAPTKKNKVFVEFVFCYWLFSPFILSSTFGHHWASLSYFAMLFVWHTCRPGYVRPYLADVQYQVSRQVQQLPFMFWQSQTVVSILTMGLSITV